MKRTVSAYFGRGHVLQDGFVERLHVGTGLACVEHCVTIERRCINDRKVELFLGCPELVEQIEGVSDHPVRTAAGTVDLVDHDDGLEAKSKGLARDETRLGHRALDRIHQQEDAVDHRQHALDLTPEIGVSRRVHDVDVRVAILDRTVLGQNRDAPFLLQIVAVHDAFRNRLVGREGPGLAQQLIDERGLAVVDVGDNGDVANGTGHGGAGSV